MPSELYRTNKTSLTNDQLLILDVIFDGGARPSRLRQRYFVEQWNAPSHSLSDEQLTTTLKQWLNDGVLDVHSHDHGRYVAMTHAGGALWASERSPIWDQYCTVSYPAVIRGRTIMSVKCVSASVRDEFLRLFLKDPARKKTATVSDNGLIKWLDFGTLHVGLASYTEPTEWTDELEETAHIERVESERCWWRTVGELQKFVGR